MKRQKKLLHAFGATHLLLGLLCYATASYWWGFLVLCSFALCYLTPLLFEEDAWE